MNMQIDEIKKAQDLIELGREHFQAGNYPYAKDCFRQAVEANPESSDGWNAFATTLCEENQGAWTQEACEYLLKAIKTNPKNVKAWNNLADFYNQRGEVEQAIEYLEKTIQLAPENYLSHGNLALAYRSQERFDEAVAGFERAIFLHSRCGWSRYQLGFTVLLRGLRFGNSSDLEQAREIFRDLQENQKEMESLPAAHELRVVETYISMELNTKEIRSMLLQNVPEQTPDYGFEAQSVQAIN